MKGSRNWSAALCILLCVFTTRASAQTPELRQAWLDARTAIRETGAELPGGRALRRYALYPYLEAEAIIQGLGTAEQYAQNIAAAAEFLERHEHTAIADAFHRQLLLRLSSLSAWPDFVALYSREVANVSRECEYLRARVLLEQTDGLAPLIEQRWLTARRLDSACEPAFRWLRETGLLDADLTAERIELLLEDGQTDFARIITRQMPAEEAAIYQQWADMLDSPLEAIDAVASGDLFPLHPAAMPGVWARASTRTPLQTFERLPDLLSSATAGADDVPQLLRDLALGLAWDRRSEALEVFAHRDFDQHDDYSLGWLTRSAIWNEQWALAERALRSMSAQSREQSDWTYWQARTAMQLGREQDANVHYSALLDRDNYYAAMAAARLGREISPNDQPVSTPASLLEQIAQRDEFVRARELFFIGEQIAATREWQYATRHLDAEQLTAAMQLASDWGWHDIAVATATRAGVFFDYDRLYPFPYVADIARAAASENLSTALIGALIRQESMFRSDAVSPANALGLMQLGLSTARETARTLGTTQPDTAALFDPATNTILGTATLSARLRRFAGQLPVALAAYNAGPAAVQRWLPDKRIDSDIWIENIPFNETREYVRRVLWNEIVYAWRLADRTAVNPEGLISTVLDTAAEKTDD